LLFGFLSDKLLSITMSKRDKQKEKDKEREKEREKEKEREAEKAHTAGAVRRSAKGVKRKAELEGSPRKAKFKKVPKKSFAECQERVSKGGWTELVTRLLSSVSPWNTPWTSALRKDAARRL
jgi:hypothetical protein